MRTIFTALSLSALALTPSAFAETETFDLVVEYEAEKLASVEGAKEVLASVKSQAKVACKREASSWHSSLIDQACYNSIVDGAIAEISAAAKEKGVAAAYVFASAETSVEVTAQ